ncbi:MAG: ABC transporter permease [Candidatus Schekmanbacteria bacterium]|nr:ABC transporter permease [Candidatus Schekmanbacteria bacterium]
MGAFVLRKALGAIPLLIAISAICFGLVRLAPGGPLARLEGLPNVRAEDIELKKKALGLDLPLPVQYGAWLVRIGLRGDLGRSFVTGEPVAAMIIGRLPATLELMSAAFLLAIAMGMSAGVMSAVRAGKALDYALTFLALVGISLPVFWIGLMAQVLFSVELGWLPAGGRAGVTEATAASFSARLRHLVMPASVLSLLYMSSWSRYMRASLLGVLAQDYIRTARAKGLGETAVVARHGVRNALIPVVTIVALQLPTLFTGAIITETIFSWPGMGLLFYDGVLKGDYPRVQAILLVSSVLIVTFNLAADLLYAVLDPRIAYR